MKISLLLNTLSKEELKLLKKAVLSPLYNTNQKVVRLYEILRPLHPNFDTSSKGLQKIYKKLFPKEAYNESKLQWHFTSLTKVIEHLLLYIAQEKAPIERQTRLIDTYQERNLDTLFYNRSENLLNKLDANKDQNTNQYLHKFKLYSDKYFHGLHNKYETGDTTLIKAMENLDSYLIIQKIRLAIALKSREQVLQEKHTINFLEGIKKVTPTSFSEDNCLIKLYRQALELAEDSNQIDFEIFEKKLFNNSTRFEFKDRQFLFFAGLNFVVKKRNAGEVNLKEKILQWYQFGLTSRLVFIDGKIEETIFANIVISGCENNLFEWTHNFIKEYGKVIITEELTETIQYYFGLVYYIKGDLDKSLDYLINCGKKSVFPPRKRAILIRALFEKYLKDESYKNLLISNLLSFKAVLKINKQFSKERLQYYVNFIGLMHQLTRKVDKKEAPQLIQQWLKERTANHLPVLAKRWIFEKVNNL